MKDLIVFTDRMDELKKFYHVTAIERTETRHHTEVYTDDDTMVRRMIINGSLDLSSPAGGTWVRGDIEFEIREVHIKKEKTGGKNGYKAS